jgi:hypothetical protein
MNHSKSEDELLQQLASLPREIVPATDAWPEIEERISSAATTLPGRGRRFQHWPLAAAASLVAVLAAGLLLDKNPGISEQGMPLATSRDAPAHPGQHPDFNVTNLAGELEYQAAFREFLAVGAATNWPDGLTENPIGQGWETLRSAEIELQTALRAEPDNLLLAARMAALRARQLELLQQIAALEMASRRNTI